MLKFLGVGNAFANKNTSAFFVRDSDLYLFDCGETVFYQLKKLRLLENKKNIYIFLTHFHSDHSGGLGTVLFYLAAKGYNSKNVKVFSPERKNLLMLLKLFDVQDLCEILTEKEVNELGIDFYRQKHNRLFSYGYLIKNANSKEYFSGDTEEMPKEILTMLLNNNLDALYIDTSESENNGYHLCYKKLLELIPVEFRKKVYCIHLKENFDYNLIEQFNVLKELEVDDDRDMR